MMAYAFQAMELLALFAVLFVLNKLVKALARLEDVLTNHSWSLPVKALASIEDVLKYQNWSLQDFLKTSKSSFEKLSHLESRMEKLVEAGRESARHSQGYFSPRPVINWPSPLSLLPRDCAQHPLLQPMGLGTWVWCTVSGGEG